jgi:hypothetical protein
VTQTYEYDAVSFDARQPLQRISWTGLCWDECPGLVGQSGVRILVGSRDFKFYKSSRPALGPTHLLFKWYRGISHGKRPGNDVYSSMPFTADVKNEWSYTSTSLYASTMRGGTTSPLFFTK